MALIKIKVMDEGETHGFAVLRTPEGEEFELCDWIMGGYGSRERAIEEAHGFVSRNYKSGSYSVVVEDGTRKDG